MAISDINWAEVERGIEEARENLASQPPATSVPSTPTSTIPIPPASRPPPLAKIARRPQPTAPVSAFTSSKQTGRDIASPTSQKQASQRKTTTPEEEEIAKFLSRSRTRKKDLNIAPKTSLPLEGTGITINIAPPLQKGKGPLAVPDTKTTVTQFFTTAGKNAITTINNAIKQQNIDIANLDQNIIKHNQSQDIVDNKWSPLILENTFVGSSPQFAMYQNEQGTLNKNADLINRRVNELNSLGNTLDSKKDRITNAYFVELDNDDLVPKMEFNTLKTNDRTLLMKSGVNAFNREKEIDANLEYRKLKKTHVEVQPGIWVTQENWDSFTPKMQQIAKTQGMDALSMEGLSGKKKFEKMQEWDLISQRSEFSGEDKEGNVEYIPPWVKGSGGGGIVGEMTLNLRKKAFQIDGWKFQAQAVVDSGIKMPSGISTSGEVKRIVVLDDKGEPKNIDVPLVVDKKKFNEWFNGLPQEDKLWIMKHYLTPLQRKNEFLTKAALTTVALTPVVGTVVFWNRMSTAEKIISGILDALILTPFVAGKLGKIPSRLTRLKVPTEIKTIFKTAENAGTQHGRLQTSLNAIRTSERMGASQSFLSSLRVDASKLATLSARADKLLAEQLEALSNINLSELKKIEKLSGQKGLGGAVKGINNVQTQLTKAWETLEQDINKGKLATNTPAHINRLESIAKLKVELDKAFEQLGSVLHPRVSDIPKLSKADAGKLKNLTNQANKLKGKLDIANNELKAMDMFDPKWGNKFKQVNNLKDELTDIAIKASKLDPKSPIAASEFGGHGINWTSKTKPFDDIGGAGGISDKLRDSIRQMDAEAKKTLGALLEKPKPITKDVLELNPIFREKPVAAPKTKPSRAPKIDKEPKPSEKVDWSRTRNTRKPNFSSSPARNILVWYSVQTILLATGKPAEDVGAKTAQQINAQFLTAMNPAFQAAVDAYNRSVTQGQTTTNTITSVENVVDNVTDATTQTVTETQTKIAIKAQVKALVREMIKVRRIRTIKFKPFHFPVPKGKAKGIEDGRYEGAVAWQQGKLKKKGILTPVWHIINSTGEKITLYEIHISMSPPVGIKVVVGARKALQSLKAQGRLPKKIDIDIGAFDLKLRTSRGGKVSGVYVRDIKGRTKGHVSAKTARVIK